MVPRGDPPPEYELTNRNSVSSKDSFDLDEEDPESQGLTSQAYSRKTKKTSLWGTLFSLLSRSQSKSTRPAPATRPVRRHALPRRHQLRRCCYLFQLCFVAISALALFTALLRPSYTRPPARYNELRHRATKTSEPGRANLPKDKVYIAASIFDPSGDLAGGAWGEAVLDLIDLLGPKNVYLSIYENDAGPRAKQALDGLEQGVECDHTFTFDEHLDPATLPHITLPDQSKRVKRIEYLAEVRNRALKPLEGSNVEFDKILYLNDVIFDPIEAAQLLFSTNTDEDGRTDYRAACAVDFINPIKFYDTFATRDAEGFSMGVPFYPWFTDAGSGATRQAVLSQKEAIMVKSCWGGMVAFDAKYFQFEFADKLNTAKAPKSAPRTGFRFRAEKDLYWDASECCLIHADIQSPDPTDTGIYLNPYIRVAYDQRTFSWLGVARRFERLYTPVQWMINRLVGLPWKNPRRDEKPGSKVAERVWIQDDGLPKGGSFQTIKRKADHAGFCGRQALQVMLSNPVPGKRPYELLPVPS